MLSQLQAQDASTLDFNVADPSDQPKDTVSSIAWSPSGNNSTFVTSDWDSQIRIYEVKEDPGTLVQEAQFDAESPCLSVKWNDDETRVFAGCADGTVKLFDILNGGKCLEIGKHEGPVKSVHWIPSEKCLLTISFDKTIKCWDLRQDGHTSELQLDYKPFCSDVLYPYLAVGLSDAKILLMDFTKSTSKPSYLDSPLGVQSQITMIKLTLAREGGYGVGLSGNEGRTNVSKFDTGGSAIRLQSVITFKVPEKVRNNETMKYSVNCFGFHPHRGYQFIYTGEADGRLFFWDSVKKGRIVDFDFKGNSITQAEVDPTGKYMAYSLGYDWARGIQGYMSQPSKVCVHALKDRELEFQHQGGKNPITYP